MRAPNLTLICLMNRGDRVRDTVSLIFQSGYRFSDEISPIFQLGYRFSDPITGVEIPILTHGATDNATDSLTECHRFPDGAPPIL